MKKVVFVLVVFVSIISSVPTHAQSIDPDHHARRIGMWAEELNAEVIDYDEMNVPHVCKLVDLFTTANGSWEPFDISLSGPYIGQIPPWAPPDYLRTEFHEAGAAHHVFGTLIDENRETIKDQWVEFRFFRGFDVGEIHEVDSRSGWSNIPVWDTFDYVFPQQNGDRGPWCWMPSKSTCEYADIVCGGGLPNGHHVSWFGAWQRKPMGPIDMLPNRTYLPMMAGG